MVNIFSNHPEMIFKRASILRHLGLIEFYVISKHYNIFLNLLFCRVNENGKDPGFGQSILHDCQLIFHTPPYNIGSGVVIHDYPVPQWPNIRHVNKVICSFFKLG